MRKGIGNMCEPLLSIRNLRAWYHPENYVLSGVSLDLNPYEAVGLIGLNGAGKTTFLKIVSGLLNTYQADSICLHGDSAAFRDNTFKYSRYTVFAEDSSFQYFTFREYLSYVFAAYHKAEMDAAPLIKGFHFEGYTDILMRELSAGNRKKAFLITAFALKPPLLLLDEPVNGLDFAGTEFLYRLIRDYKKHGTILFSSHVLESITMTSDRVLILEGGRIGRHFERGEIDGAQIREALHYEEEF